MMLEESNLLADLAALHPRFAKLRSDLRADPKLRSIQLKAYTKRKMQILKAEEALNKQLELSLEKQRELVDAILNDSPSKIHPTESKGIMSMVLGAVTHFVPADVFSSAGDKSSDVVDCEDAAFLRRLSILADKFPVLAELVHDILAKATEHFSGHIDKAINKVIHHLEIVRIDECKKQLDAKSSNLWTTVVNESRREFLHAVKDSFVRGPQQ